MNTRRSLRSHTRLGLGSTLAAIGALLMVLSPLVGWYSFPSPWDFLLGFATGLLAGIGTALVIGDLIERRHKSWRRD